MADTESEVGFVENVYEDRAVINLSESDACKSCSAKILCRPDRSGQRKVVALNKIKATVGQRVYIEEMGNMLFKLSMMQFGIPLVGLLLGIFLAYQFKWIIFNTPPELSMSIFGFIGILLGGLISHFWARKKASKTSIIFEVKSICAD